MKAEQLMINDIVMLVVTEYNELEDKEVVSRHPARITDISPNDQLYDIDGESCSFFYSFLDGFDGECYDCYMEPIPITTEILLANGFEFEEFDYVRYNQKKYYYRYTDEHCINRGVRIDEIYTREGDPDGFYIWDFCSIKYVYELQHALRLRSLNELADNLKLE